MEEKTKGQLLQEELTWKFPLIAEDDPSRIEKAMAFCEPYKTFMSEVKTEREFVTRAVEILKEAGYTVFDPSKKYVPGDKVYYANRGKSLIATTFGEMPVDKGVRLNAAHIDFPRIDLKPNPLYEKNDLAFFKTHYYGGIRKYQWVTIPLALHGVVCKKNGENINIVIGEDPSEPVLYITDLLPHLAAKQNQRHLGEGIKGEELNVLLGSLPYPDDKIKEAVKLNILAILNEKYGITEGDFFRAELELVAAGPARDVGLDRSMIMAAGHDDRVCAYTALMADIDTKVPRHTTVTIFADKEEIGSVGNTGLDSDFVLHYLKALTNNAGIKFREISKRSICLSSDVSAAYDPTFSDVSEPMNTCYLGKGPVLMKYTGARGKSASNDASAETMARIIGIMEREGVYWQAGELGKVDEGGGGTVAKYVAHMDIDVIDFGVPVLAMHAPNEIVSKMDVYETYLAYKAFYK